MARHLTLALRANGLAQRLRVGDGTSGARALLACYRRDARMGLPLHWRPRLPQHSRPTSRPTFAAHTGAANGQCSMFNVQWKKGQCSMKSGVAQFSILNSQFSIRVYHSSSTVNPLGYFALYFRSSSCFSPGCRVIRQLTMPVCLSQTPPLSSSVVTVMSSFRLTGT